MVSSFYYNHLNKNMFWSYYFENISETHIRISQKFDHDTKGIISLVLFDYSNKILVANLKYSNS